MKAIILTSQRSGSTFLQSCLNAHPSIRCYGELLVGGHLSVPELFVGHRLPTKAYRYITVGAWNPVGIMDRYFDRAEAPVVMFKAMYNHVDNIRVRAYLAQHPEIRIIHLRRENLLKQYVSKVLLTAKSERAWLPHTTSPVPVVSVRISPDLAIKEMCRVRDAFSKFESLLADHHKIHLEYESLFNGSTLAPDAWKKIGQLLDIEPASVASDLVKMNPNLLRPMVENYDELASALTGTEWEHYLDLPNAH
jgi:LPS sulfotransferase NodH